MDGNARPLTPAEKQAAYRQRQKEAEEAAAQRQKDAEEVRAAREAYVEREVAITRHQIETGQLKTHDKDGNDLHRLDESEAYARWRWQGVQDGTVAAL